MNKNLYLTDKQYQSILLKIKKTVEQNNFQYNCVDSTSIGDKYTKSNCGFCNNDFTEKDTALFPEQYPERKSMKYRLANHKCPFDMRTPDNLDMGYGNGCFCRCYLFHTRKINITTIKKLVNDTINEGR